MGSKHKACGEEIEVVVIHARMPECKCTVRKDDRDETLQLLVGGPTLRQEWAVRKAQPHLDLSLSDFGTLISGEQELQTV